MHASSRFAHFLSYCLLHPTLLVGVASKVTQKVRRRLLRRSSAILDSFVEQQHLLAKTWCSTHAVNIADLSRHLPFSFVALRVEESYPDYITGALLRSRTCPATVGGSANLDLLFSLARSISARRIVETGVALDGLVSLFCWQLQTESGTPSFAASISHTSVTGPLLGSVEQYLSHYTSAGACFVWQTVRDYLRHFKQPIP